MAVKTLVREVEYDLAPLTKSLGFLARVVLVPINERVRADGRVQISPAAFSTLRLLQANPGIRQVHAASILVIQESNMANLIKDLIGKGLVERREKAGKRIGLWITAKGKHQVERGKLAYNLDRTYAKVLSNKEYTQLLRLLERVYLASIT